MNCRSTLSAAVSGTVSGTVSYRERIALPQDAVAEVDARGVVDVEAADALLES